MQPHPASFTKREERQRQYCQRRPNPLSTSVYFHLPYALHLCGRRTYRVPRLVLLADRLFFSRLCASPLVVPFVLCIWLLLQTYVGSILIAMNPFRMLGLYTDAMSFAYTNVLNKSDHPPHLFSIADAAFHSMVRSGKPQVCLIQIYVKFYFAAAVFHALVHWQGLRGAVQQRWCAGHAL